MLADLYEAEYNTTNITKAELCDKYNISMSDLAHIKEPQQELETTPSIVVVDEPKQTQTNIQTHTNTSLTTEDNSEAGEFLTSIYAFKTAALKEAHSQLVGNYELDSRELKNLVSTVDILEKSVTKTDGAGNTVNIMVQNIMNKYDDDC